MNNDDLEMGVRELARKLAIVFIPFTFFLLIFLYDATVSQLALRLSLYQYLKK